MKILFAARENAWGGFLQILKAKMPQHEFHASGYFGFKTLEGFDVLIPTMSVVDKNALSTGDRLKLIQQCGSGLEAVDIGAAHEMNIRVANVPTDISGNAESVAELGIFMMLGLSRHLNKMKVSFSNWQMGVPQGRALKGKTVGVIGLGGIGRALIKRLKAFDVHILGIRQNNPEATVKELDIEWAGTQKDLGELLKRSDYVVLCLPLTSDSKNIIDADAFNMMKPGSFIINLSRGGLIDHDALEQALKANKIDGAGLDVFWEEPPNPDDPIFQYNVLATPHIAGSTDVSMQGIVSAVAENINRLEKGLEPLYLK
ncbi:MAG TPA: 2-hydroxyacid dehydrogenase [Smithella sp.]|nr:2-hydroxyacid dehydrogenase [Smithella sp.]